MAVPEKTSANNPKNTNPITAKTKPKRTEIPIPKNTTNPKIRKNQTKHKENTNKYQLKNYIIIIIIATTNLL